MLGVGLLATVFISLHIKEDIEQEAVRQFAFTCDQVTLKIQERLDAYAQILRGGTALFAASREVERSQWQIYVEALHAERTFLGVQGIGFAQVIPADQLAAHIARIRSEGFPEYTVRPSGERAVYTSIVYLEPFRDRNLRAFGFDMYSEPVRRTAMEQARDTGEAALSGKVELVQETGTDVHAGILMYVPVYRNGMPKATVGQKRAALVGWVYSPYRMNDLMAGVLQDWVYHDGKIIDLTIFDGLQATSATLLFDSKPIHSPDLPSLFHQRRAIDFNGHQWLLAFAYTKTPTVMSYAPALAALAGGFALSGLLFGLMRSVVNTQANAVRIADKLTEEIRNREELLKESDAFKLTVLNALPAQIAVLDRGGVIQMINEPWKQFALQNAIEPDKFVATYGVGANYLEVCQDVAGLTENADQLHPNHSIQAVLDGDLPSFSMEYNCDSPTEQRWFMMTVLPLGKCTSRGAVVTHTNITERKLSEAALLESRNLLSTIIDTAPIRVFWKDNNLHYLGCNKAFAIDAGFLHPKDVIGKDDYQMGWADRAELYRADDRAVIESGIAKLFYDESLTTAGKTILINTSKVLLRNQNNEVIGLLGIYNDITEHKRLETEIQEAKDYAESIIDNMLRPLLVLDSELKILTASCSFYNTFEVIPEETIGNLIYDLGNRQWDIPQLRIFFEDILPNSTVFNGFEVEHDFPDIGHKIMLVNAREIFLEGIGSHIILLIMEDITERRQAEEQLRLAGSVFTHASEGIMITATDGTILDVNDAFSRITSYSHDEVLGQNPRILSSGRHGKTFYADLWGDLTKKGQWYGEVWNRRKNGEVYAVMQHISAVRDAQNNLRNYVAMFSDITRIKEHEHELDQMAHYDALTSLPNRVLLADHMRQGMAQAKRRSQLLAVAFLDLDGFKTINDDYGHEAGDQFLITVAERMKQTLREGDTLARLGGDEFVAVLLDLADETTSEPMLTRLLSAAAQPVQFGDIILQVSASLGVTFYPQADDLDAEQMLRQADQAMYQAKQAGKNRYHLFDALLDRNIRGHYESLESIRHALTAGEFVLYYQPKVDMRTGAIIGAEALIRWQHPDKGLLPPAVFLPVIEEHALAVDIGEWVIGTALAQIELWQAAGLNIPVSVNVSARQLLRADFMVRLRELLAAHPNVRHGYLELEVLETSAMEDLVKASGVINASRKLGVSFALDDFGTGYSSLTYLKRLPVSMLKIDQSFVRDMLDDPDDLAILEGVLGLATAFRLPVIAEGVETVEHGSLLLQLGCNLAQGYGIARPMPANQLPGWSGAWRPDPVWAKMHSFNREDTPLLFAQIEHRAWIAATEKYLKGEREAPLPLDINQCRFGQWLDDEGLARYGTQPSFVAIERLHRQVHELVTEMYKLDGRGCNPEALARLDELHSLCEALHEQFKALVQDFRQWA